MRRLATLTCALMMSCAAMIGIARAEPRVALIMGNGDYNTIGDLANPTHDAQDIAKLINRAGFEAHIGTDLTLEDMRDMLKDFVARVKERGVETTALVFFAGHGLQIDGENYLVPTDAKIESEDDVKTQALPLSEVMSILYTADIGVRIVLLDACRNNPFKTVKDSSGSGLVLVDAPKGSVIGFSTSPGTEALDGAGKDNSPYAEALLSTIREPGLDLDDLLRKVRVKVHNATDGAQIPWETWGLERNFEFFAEEAAAVAGAPVQPKIAKVTKIEDLKTIGADAAYDAVITEDRVDFYQEFVRLYPDDALVDRVRLILQRRRQMIDWQQATVENSRESYERYIDRHPNSFLGFNANKLRDRQRVAPISPVFIKSFNDNRGSNNGGFNNNNGLGNLGRRADFGRLPTNVGSAAGTGFGGNKVFTPGTNVIRTASLPNGGNLGNKGPVVANGNSGINGGNLGNRGSVNTGINGGNAGTPGNIKTGTGPVTLPNGNTGINGGNLGNKGNTPTTVGTAPTNTGINGGNVGNKGPVVVNNQTNTTVGNAGNPGNIKTGPVTLPNGNTGINGGNRVVNNNSAGGVVNVNRDRVINNQVQIQRQPNFTPRIQPQQRFSAPVQSFQRSAATTSFRSFGGGGGGGGGFGRGRR